MNNGKKEKTIKLEFTRRQLINLATFLNRADLKGGEVAVFVDLMNVLNRANLDDGKREPEAPPQKAPSLGIVDFDKPVVEQK